jgi:hypothetical protein
VERIYGETPCFSAPAESLAVRAFDDRADIWDDLAVHIVNASFTV